MLENNPVVAIIRTPKTIDLNQVCHALYDGGIDAVEITLPTPGSLSAITSLSKQLPGGKWIGCGTVTNVDEAKSAMDAGAQFIVTPILDSETMSLALERDVPIFPGAFSPTEIFRASQLGATMVKVFPAGQLGPQYLKAVLAPLPNLRLMPTGGVSIDNLDAWLDAGASALGVGSSLVKNEWLEKSDFTSIRRAAEQWTAKINQYQSMKQ